MNSQKTTARIVGACFLTSNVTFLLGASVFLESILGTPDYLSLASANKAQIIMGVLLELINGVAYVGIVALMFPILKRRFESLALGYVVFRAVEFVMQIASDRSPLALLSVSQEFVQAGAPQASAFQPLGTLLLAERQSAFLMISITFGLGALLFYYMLYQLKLIPRFISVWGFVGGVFVLTSVIVDMFGLTLDPALEMILGLPMLLNELFLGVWLIFKGFNASATVSKPERPVPNEVQMSAVQ